MSKGAIGALVAVGAVVLFVAMVVMSLIGAYNSANRLENTIVAAWKDNEQFLGQYGQKLREAAQVPGMQRDDLIAMFKAANEARYGGEGSGAVMQWIQEQNPNLDQATYVQIQRIVEAGRTEFAKAQKRLIDAKRTYSEALGSFPKGVLMRMFGYPRIAIGYPFGSRDDYPAVSTAHARGAFESGIEEPIQLR